MRELPSFTIRADGTIESIYSDGIKPMMLKMGRDITITRASHVEPGLAYGVSADRWVADMMPSNGPILLGPDGLGYETREQALDAEREWLRRERGL